MFPIGKYIVLRSEAAGVHLGVLDAYDPVTRHALLKDTRRIYRWDVAFTLSAVALNGIPSGKLSVTIPTNIVAGVIELTPCSEEAEKILREFVAYAAE